jgi:diguanylate cyclase (GGDEF)-like protein/PAS domain S-box-containing protein
LDIDNIKNKLILLAADSIPDPIFVLDINGKYVTVIGGNENSLYDSPKHLIGKTIMDVLPKQAADFFLSVIKSVIDTKEMQILEYQTDAAEIKASPRDGPTGRQWFEGRVSPVILEEESEKYVIWSAINITAKKKAEAERENLTSQIKYLANHDYLTGLPTLRYSLELLDIAILKADKTNKKLALLFLDIDGFKIINDTYGHAAGDVVLRILAKRFIQVVAKTGVVCRIGGDEFIVIVPDFKDVEYLKRISEKLIKTTQKVIHYLDLKLNLTLSIGASIYPDFADDSESLRKKADEQMYKVKKSGKNSYSIMTS